jgi:16S rRNA processing protein RimM
VPRSDSPGGSSLGRSPPGRSPPGRSSLGRIPPGCIQLGVIGRPHGVRGLVKISSHTADPADLTAYGPLSDAEGHRYEFRWKAEGVAEVSRIVDGVAVRIADRGAAEKLTNTRLFIDRSALPPTEGEEYYLTDLIGLTVVDPSGGTVGTVLVVHDYGAGASLEIEQQAGPPLLVPFTAACVPTVDIAHDRLVVVPPEEIVVQPDANLTVHPDVDETVQPGADEVVSPDPQEHRTVQPRAEDAAA